MRLLGGVQIVVVMLFSSMLEINDVVLSNIAPRYCVVCDIEAFTLSVDRSLHVFVLGMLSGSLLGNLTQAS